MDEPRKETGRRRRGLKYRWIMGSLLPVIGALTVIAVLVSVGLSTNYYQSARTTLREKVENGADYFNSYVMSGYDNYLRNAMYFASDYADADHMELQFLDTMGMVEVSTQGVMSGTHPNTHDIVQAISSGETGLYTGKSDTGERIMAVSTLLKYNGRVVGIMRGVAGIALLDQRVALTVVICVIVWLAVMILITLSSMLFINSVVAPIAAVSEAAKEISGGSYGVQITNRYSDEMGELVDNINDMSVKIGQNEKLQSEFVSSVSHELRTPLTAINGWGETLLATGPDDPETFKRGLGIIVKESARLTQMVEELLDFSRMSDGRFTLQLEPTDLQAEFEDAIFTYQELFRKDGITLEYEPEDLEPVALSADPQRLKQVFCNVLDNARKHGGSGKRITAAMTRKGHRFIITIRDYGPGIPKTELPHVKEKFYKGSSKARGNGIGLAVCDEIIRLHGGTFTIGNARGGGTIVTIRLPIHEAENKN